MITDRLKNDVIFVTVDGAADGFSEQRALVTNRVVDRYRELGLRVIRFSANENHADILIPQFDEHPYRNRLVVSTMYSYPYFVMRDMQLQLSDYTHTIRFEWDGYPIDFTKWTDDFLDYDLLAEPTSHHRYDGNRYGLYGGMSLKSKKADKILREKVTTEYWKSRIDVGKDYNEDVITNDMLTDYKGWEWNDIFSKWHSTEPDYSAFGFHKSIANQDYYELGLQKPIEIRV
ncbi:MAG: hypothetical protein CMM99_05445 [Rickettsiales bacterium]|nr:hypothetical protein [Rickettsiales bacterium]